MRPPSGRQVVLTHGEQRAVVVEVGGGLRSYRAGARDVVDGYREGEMCSGGRGQLLLPWPNRIRDGRYSFGGARLQLPITEVERHNAIHGLVRWQSWDVADQTTSRAVMTHELHPQPGYPFALSLRADYALDAAGLTVRLGALNVGTQPCPFGAGAHPYLRAGTRPVDDASLQLAAGVMLETDERGIPTGRRLPVGETAFDFRAPRRIGAAVLDVAFGELERDAGGLARVVLQAGTETTTVWMDAAYSYVMVFSGDTLASVGRRRHGLAVEPMTCAPDAFTSGDGLLVLEPGESHTAAWGITPG